jgi:PAS domain S-box-containing protein
MGFGPGKKANSQNEEIQTSLGEVPLDPHFQESHLLNALMEYLPDRIYYKDLQSRIIFGSRSYAQLFDLEDFSEIRGKTDFDFFSEEHARAAFEDEHEIIRTGKAKLDLEEMETWPDGRVTWCSTSKAPLRDDQGRIIGTFGISKDITDRKLADAARRNQENELTTIFENAPFMMLLLDQEGRVRRGNGLASNFMDAQSTGLIGRSMGEALGCRHELKDPRGCQHSEQCQQCILHMQVQACHENGQSQHQVEASLFRRFGGKDQNFTLRISTAKVTVGNDPMVLLSIQDITEHKKLEEQLRHIQKMEAIGTLAGGVAHDFNNFLTAIIGFATLAKMKMPVDDPNGRAINQILSASERATHLTHSLLAFSRKQVMSLKPVNLNDLVRRIEKLLGRLIGEDIEMPTRLAADEVFVMADAGQIEQVLMNLVTNARDALPEGGLIAIITEEAELDEYFVKAHGFGNPGKYALMTVSDNGCGMDEGTRAKIFEPFFTTKELGRGTGLGLSIVYGIVKQHGGYILVYSEPGHGTSFKIYLPLIKSLPDSAPSLSTALPRRGTETILLAEDDSDVRNLTRTVLEDFGYQIITAVDGQDAIVKFGERAADIDLILMDVIMPKKGGLESYEAIKSIRPGIKVLFYSGYSHGSIQNEKNFHDNLNYISKPVSPITLLNKIRELLDESK